MDFREGMPSPRVRTVPDPDLLQYEFYNKSSRESDDDKTRLRHANLHPLQGRIIIIEDLTKDVIELLGTELDIDPLFFAMHLHAVRKSGMHYQTPHEATLPSRLLPRQYLNVPYHRVVTCDKLPSGGERLVRDTGIDRKIVFIRSTPIGLAQHCASVILIKNNRDFWLSIILVDPPIRDTFFTDDRKSKNRKQICLNTSPFLGIYEDFLPPPTFAQFSEDAKRPFSTRCKPEGPNRGAMLHDLKYYWTQKLPADFDPKNPSLHALLYYPLRIIAAEWTKYIAVMHHCIKRYEYNNEQLPDLNRFNTDLRDLQSWRRRSMMSQQKLEAIKHFLEESSSASSALPSEISPGSQKNHLHNCGDFGISSLYKDYTILLTNLTTSSTHLNTILPTIITFIQIAYTRRSFAETANITRLTILALVFVPLTYISSLFSMNSNNAPGSDGFWVYFAVAAPVTILVGCIARPPVEELRVILKWLRDERMRGWRRRKGGKTDGEDAEAEDEEE
ncbi:hypothetical protein B0J11DRAFT_599171 [Dendryphion nanum]|uniref:Uncharacterized protein n=1 Tax=Dendryphion nanum TaxID=256645 RepID=A0A9P9D1S0_9PLEO|nr:hypothetical protein B0J11DRAFT_599171 [Dendryphion nanum]